MKKIIYTICAAAMATVALAGCAGNHGVIANKAISSRQDVFQEAQTGQVTEGKAMLDVMFPVKSYETYFLNTYIKHTDPPYNAILNIDGQAVVLSDEPQLENLPGDFRTNPEVGTGWKYNFRKTLALQPGKHSIMVAVPLADVMVEKTIELKAGENSLKVLPIYNSSVSRNSWIPRFSHGLQGIAIKINDQDC